MNSFIEMQVAYSPYRLKFKQPFVLSNGTRLFTDSVIVRIKTDKTTAYGESTLPPYVKENSLSVIDFLKKASVFISDNTNSFEQLHHNLISNFPNDTFARCAFTEAFNSLYANKNANPLPTYSNYNCSLTISGNVSDEQLKQQFELSKNFGLIKIKLTGTDDLRRVEAIQSFFNLPVAVDVNQGWNNFEKSKALAKTFEKLGVLFIEQPFAFHNYELHRQLKQEVDIPIIADESIQNENDLRTHLHCFDGANIKLLKCGGPLEAQRMIDYLQEQKKIAILGCMSESSCGVWHAAHLANQVNFVDLDGPYLISNDPFSGFQIQANKLVLDELKLINELEFIEL